MEKTTVEELKGLNVLGVQFGLCEERRGLLGGMDSAVHVVYVCVVFRRFRCR